MRTLEKWIRKIAAILLRTQLGQGLRVLVAEYRDFNPGSSTWK